MALKWRHNELGGVSNHWGLLFIQQLNLSGGKLTKKNPSTFHATGLCEGNSPVTGEFPHKGPVTREMLPFDDVIMGSAIALQCTHFIFILVDLWGVVSKTRLSS